MPKFIRIGPWSYYRKTKDERERKKQNQKGMFWTMFQFKLI